MITFDNVSKQYKNTTAVKNLSFAIQEGQLVGLVGENGAGKTTILNMLAGYKQPTSGNIIINSKKFSEHQIELKQQIGYLPESVPLYEGMFVMEYLEFVFAIKKPSINKKEHLKELMDELKLTEVSQRLIQNLSKGYKQRIGLCAALIGYPPIILLDEPTSGLDPIQIKIVRKLLNRLKGKHTILFSSHILNEVQNLCDDILFISKGELKENVFSDKSNPSQQMQYELLVQGNKSTIQKKLKQIKEIRSIRYKNKEGEVHTFIVVQKANSDCRTQIMKLLQRQDCQLLELKQVESNLEELFFEVKEGKK